jgi:DNA-binding transcriptional LysR family regulator
MAHNVSIRQLQAFREVMRSGSVSEAARILGRTQPAVSALIANLEAELQLSLFRRQKGRMEPTPIEVVRGLWQIQQLIRSPPRQLMNSSNQLGLSTNDIRVVPQSSCWIMLARM